MDAGGVECGGKGGTTADTALDGATEAVAEHALRTLHPATDFVASRRVDSMRLLKGAAASRCRQGHQRAPWIRVCFL